MTNADNKLEFPTSVAVLGDELDTQTKFNGFSVTITTPSDTNTIDQMSIVEVSGTLDFWDDPAEDQYSEMDGDAI